MPSDARAALDDPERHAVVDVLHRHGGPVGLQWLVRRVTTHAATAATGGRAHERAVWLRLTGPQGHLAVLDSAGIVAFDGETAEPGPDFEAATDALGLGARRRVRAGTPGDHSGALEGLTVRNTGGPIPSLGDWLIRLGAWLAMVGGLLLVFGLFVPAMAVFGRQLGGAGLGLLLVGGLLEWLA